MAYLNCLSTVKIFAALLVTGGINVDGYEVEYCMKHCTKETCNCAKRTSAVEVILPSGRSCSLPSLPIPRESHTQSGLTACGGYAGFNYKSNTTLHSCVTFAARVWNKSHTLAKTRWFHVAWQSPVGIFLIGGTGEKSRTVLLSTTTSTTSLGFDMPDKIL